MTDGDKHTTQSMIDLWDVVAINIQTQKRRIIAESKAAADAEAIVMMAVARRGVDTEFFRTVPHGSESDADAE